MTINTDSFSGQISQPRPFLAYRYAAQLTAEQLNISIINFTPVITALPGSLLIELLRLDRHNGPDTGAGVDVDPDLPGDSIALNELIPPWGSPTVVHLDSHGPVPYLGEDPFSHLLVGAKAGPRYFQWQYRRLVSGVPTAYGPPINWSVTFAGDPTPTPTPTPTPAYGTIVGERIGSHVTFRRARS